MSLFSLIRRAPKRLTAAALMIAAAIIIPTAALAWGPSRDTYTVEQPADKVVFNSITNNPNYGDERNFVTIKDSANQNTGTWVDDITVTNNKEYYVRMYVHNNAAANLNLIAQNVTAKFNVPTYNSNKIQIDGYLSSTNADPTQVWDQAIFHGPNDSKFKLEYVAGSATYTNNVYPSGTGLPDSVVGAGAKLGYENIGDGNIPGCFQYSGAVIFKVKAVTSEFDVQKTVRMNGIADKTFKETVNAKAGDKVDYQIYFENKGGAVLNDVSIKDTLPAGMTYVAGSTMLYNANGNRTVADGVTTTGLNIGNYGPTANAYIRFTAQVAGNDNLPVCGPNTLKNVVKATTAVGAKEDDANVIVPKECLPEVKYTCDALAITRISRTDFKFQTTYTVQNATFKNVTYIIRDDKGVEVERKTSTNTTLNYTQTKVGKYTVEAVITVTVNGQDKTVSSANCKKEFEVPSTPEYCPIPGKEYLPKDSKDCVTVPELPHTGATENIVAIVGLGALIASIAYYVASRRALNQ